uniref:C2H2-type domain-containing protein n=1 Tax=Steinernema glaseri TaxID=37863 RepID=A0A1I7YU63_9BILA
MANSEVPLCKHCDEYFTASQSQKALLRAHHNLSQLAIADVRTGCPRDVRVDKFVAIAHHARRAAAPRAVRIRNGPRSRAKELRTPKRRFNS